MIKDIIGNRIIIDCIETWPDEIKKLILNNSNTIFRYYCEKERLFKVSQADPMFRYNPVRNKYEDDLNAIYKKLDLMLEDHEFIGFHCSRLLPHEIKIIIREGIKPLNREFINRKIELMHKHDYIDINDCEYLLANNHSEESCRKDMVYTFSCLGTLQESLGLERLFRFWGGEAIFVGKEKEIDLRKRVLDLGKSSILICILKNCDSKNNIENLATKLVSFYYSNKRNDPYLEYELEIAHSKTVKVESILTEEMDIFEELTKFSTWKLYY